MATESAARETRGRGGKRTAQKYGPDHFRKLGDLGGGTTRDKYGVEYLRSLGAKGGAKTAERGSSYYAAIGAKGGAAGRGKPKPRKSEKLIEPAQKGRQA